MAVAEVAHAAAMLDGYTCGYTFDTGTILIRYGTIQVMGEIHHDTWGKWVAILPCALPSQRLAGLTPSDLASDLASDFLALTHHSPLSTLHDQCSEPR